MFKPLKQTTITVKLRNNENLPLKMELAAELSQKAIVSSHTYETPLGCFTVKKSKTIIIEEN